MAGNIISAWRAQILLFCQRNAPHITAVLKKLPTTSRDRRIIESQINSLTRPSILSADASCRECCELLLRLPSRRLDGGRRAVRLNPSAWCRTLRASSSRAILWLFAPPPNGPRVREFLQSGSSLNPPVNKRVRNVLGGSAPAKPLEKLVLPRGFGVRGKPEPISNQGKPRNRRAASQCSRTDLRGLRIRQITRVLI